MGASTNSCTHSKNWEHGNGEKNLRSGFQRIWPKSFQTSIYILSCVFLIPCRLVFRRRMFIRVCLRQFSRLFILLFPPVFLFFSLQNKSLTDSQDKLTYIQTSLRSNNHRCMGGFVLGTSQPNFEPDSKARPNLLA